VLDTGLIRERYPETHDRNTHTTIPTKVGIQCKPEGQGPTCLHVGECRDSDMR
jgi:hypothetical protein